MTAAALMIMVVAQASDVRVIPAPPVNHTVESVTRSGHDYNCEFYTQAGSSERLVVIQRGGRGYQTDRDGFPVSKTPLRSQVLLNETPAVFFANIETHMSDSVFVFRSSENGETTGYLAIQPDRSAPDYEIDGRSSARLRWGPMVQEGSRRWWANDIDGSCQIEEVAQLPLSETETKEFLAQ